ncbi:MAG: hypothetical protein BWY43_00607 [candidate division WS2 bacterium ADurb.Bin280]|uniref:Uncharacterized protein n=1 Tax=candidate division WS2 bacterium ADurb.Bin280 TaxID=1852829 RepID=A0A1V5SDQ4_9BACT|nr:MAG: hypothetical protein BWY43_00607 [candidate division WS2 bacterium ADurb.Bin280]
MNGESGEETTTQELIAKEENEGETDNNPEPTRKLGFVETFRAQADARRIVKLKRSADQARIALDQADESLRNAPATGGYSGEPVNQNNSHNQSVLIGKKAEAEENYKNALQALEQARADYDEKYGQGAQ